MPNHPSDVRKEIERRLALHAEAHASQDLERALQLYTKDAVVRPANMEPVSGHSQLRQFFSKWWSAMTIEEIRYTTVELHVHSIAAYQIGTYEGVQKPHGQESKVDRGSFMIVWNCQEDGSWRYHRGIFNSSLPVDVTITKKA